MQKDGITVAFGNRMETDLYFNFQVSFQRHGSRCLARWRSEFVRDWQVELL